MYFQVNPYTGYIMNFSTKNQKKVISPVFSSLLKGTVLGFSMAMMAIVPSLMAQTTTGSPNNPTSPGQPARINDNMGTPGAEINLMRDGNMATPRNIQPNNTIQPNNSSGFPSSANTSCNSFNNPSSGMSSPMNPSEGSNNSNTSGTRDNNSNGSGTR